MTSSRKPIVAVCAVCTVHDDCMCTASDKLTAVSLSDAHMHASCFPLSTSFRFSLLYNAFLDLNGNIACGSGIFAGFCGTKMGLKVLRAGAAGQAAPAGGIVRSKIKPLRERAGLDRNPPGAGGSGINKTVPRRSLDGGM